MEIKTDTLESLCELIVDCPHSTPKWTDEGIVVLRNQYIRNGTLDLSDPSYTNEEDYQKRIKRAVPQAGDIVFTREAPMGEVCLIPEGLKCCLGQRQVLLRPRKDISGEYLFWALQSPYVQHQISWNEGTGTTVSNVRIPVLKALKIPRHPQNEAQAAGILSALADKIQLNRQTNQTLEKMAQALFKSWFVDFDPVIDNALAAGNTIPEPLQKRVEQRRALRASFETQGSLSQDQPAPLPEAIRQLFPASFVFDAEMGWIPEGWHIDQIKVLCKKIQNGGTPKRDNPDFWENGTIPWLASGEVRQTIVSQTEQSITDLGLEKSSAKWLPAGSTVIAMYGATAGQVAYVANALTTNQAVCGLIPNDGYQYFNYMALERCVHSLAHQARGSAQQNISKGIIEETKLIIPDGKVVEQFEKLCSGIFSKWIKNNSEEITLAKLRDTLLPKLISGELRIPEAQQQTEAAVA